VCLFCLLAGMTVLVGFYITGLFQGSSWLPGGSRLQKDNMVLSRQLDHLEGKITELSRNLRESYHLQSLLALSIGIEPLDEQSRLAGIGGREPIGAVGDLNVDLNQLLRQTRIQHKSYQAILDTLANRESVRSRTPSIRPVDVGWLSSGFGRREDPFTGKSRFHSGLDFSVPLGTEVRATGDGVVVALKRERGLGRMVRIDHGNNVTTAYGHLSEWLVKSGQKVKRGQIIALSGNSGRSTAPHLHYEVAVKGQKVDPRSFILDSYAIR
jgi:murein DD-endopeptidase MepM/ murein hydrolase activator NlpD